MKNILITGITGQDGLFLTSEIIKNNKEVNIVGTTRKNENELYFKRLNSLNCKSHGNINLVKVNLENEIETFEFMKEVSPDCVINLSGPSSVYKSLLKNSNTKNSITNIFNNLTNSLIKTNNFAKFFQASSSEMFDNVGTKKLDEKSNFNPKSPYAEGKLENHLKVLELNKKYEWPIYSGIMFNHESQFRDDNYLFMKVIKTIEKIKSGEEKYLTIGSLDYVRDWTYSKDTVKAILSIVERGKSPDYVIGTGKGHRIFDLVNLVFNHYKLDIEKHLLIDEKLLRKGDPMNIVSNPSKIYQELKWSADVTFKELINICIESKE